MKPGYLRGTDCRPVAEILSRIGDKWSVMLVMELSGGTKRFSELRRTLHGISQKMLTTALRGLERDGFVTRTIHPTIPPKVEYRLTDLGVELAIPVRALGEWATQNRARILAAREQYDKAAEMLAAPVESDRQGALQTGHRTPSSQYADLQGL